ncbi:hypothetical protein N7478_011393 [Penicillium angulare]|uniref:uncharacterized protein n=1 Tax=Penicillium angulare TaxID=116970 RepID=UPI0025420B0D|nr:uncharacterized protein N7478_011393 [Penicillium angulare]KAJ5263788.1 hypothetical protein N7478_011393 [Penicillium angulare]
MAPTIHTAKITLSCPLFAADFDPRNNGRLLVGGGGGEGRSGVGNKISLLDTSHRNEIKEAVELNLSRDEDSVTSLAVAPQVGDEEYSLVTYAGINSSVAEQKKNNNQHMRAFRFHTPRKVLNEVGTVEEGSENETEKKDSKPEEEIIPGKTEQLSRTSLFRFKSGADAGDAYQRVLRLSPWKEDTEGDKRTPAPRVGAITTGLAPSGEIVFFDATESPAQSDVIGRIRLSSNEEAEDVDFASLEFDPEQTKNARGRFRVAYTNGTDVMVGEISSSTRSNAAPDVKSIYTIPLPSSGARAQRPKFRALRFLSPDSILLLQNAPNRSGSELLLIKLPNNTDSQAQAKIVRRRKLPRTMKIALGLDICALGTNPAGQQQIIIAASGSDNSIALFTVEYGPNRGFEKIHPFSTLRDVHPFSMTKLCFSTFTPPAHPVTPEVPPQKVKLASTSMGNTVVVHTIPLSPFPASSRTPRYTLTLPGPSEFMELIAWVFILICSFSAIIFALLVFVEMRGGTPPYLGVQSWLPDNIRNSFSEDYIPPKEGQGSYFDYILSPRGTPPTVESTFPSPDGEDTENINANALESLKQILDKVHNTGAAPADIEPEAPRSLSVIVRCNEHGETAEQSILIETSSTAHHQQLSAADDLRPWKDLSGVDQAAWKRRLTDAGRWAADEGESVLQGVLFSEACGQLRGVVGNGLP